jgi:hypothetical protein
MDSKGLPPHVIRMDKEVLSSGSSSVLVNGVLVIILLAKEELDRETHFHLYYMCWVEIFCRVFSIWH